MRLIIPGSPIAKARPKFAICNGHARAYDSQSKLVVNAKKDLSFRISEHLVVNDHQRASLKASFSDQKKVALTFLVEIAQSDSMPVKTKKLWAPEFGEWHAKKDLDNYIKYILDVGNGILWHDDSQIVELHAYQKYSENPCTIIEITDIKKTMNFDADKLCRIFSPAALEKLESDLACVTATLETFRLCQREDRNTHLEAAAASLKAFSSTYCDSLKKLTAKNDKCTAMIRGFK